MKILFQLISITNASIPKGDIERMHTLLEDNGVDVEALLGKLAPKCETIIDKCKWKAEEKRCRTLFEPQITSSGFCCSFNYYGVEKGESKEKQGFVTKTCFNSFRKLYFFLNFFLSKI